MKVLRKSWPRVRETFKHGRNFYVVDLRKKGHKANPKWFSVKNTALEYAAGLGDKLEQNGIQSLGFDPRLKPWEQRATLIGKSLDEVVEAGFTFFNSQKKVSESPFMSELLTLWIDDKTNNTLKPLRERTRKTIRAMGNQFKEEFKDAKIREVGQTRIEEFLKLKNVGQQTKKNLLSHLNQFYFWCIRKKYYDHNPAEHIQVHVANGVPEYYTVEECKSIMKEMLKPENKCLVSYFALCLFGGVRPYECERMQWNTNVKLDTHEVYVTASISKTKKDRIFSMSPALVAWLEYAKDEKPLIPANFRKLKDKALKNVKNVEFIADGLRHTFATFSYAQTPNLETLRSILGNSPNVIEKFYKGAIAKAEVEKFWDITPTSLQQKPS